MHIVSAWCHANQLVLVQEKVDSKSNEITALSKLIELLDLQGRIDAMGAQRDICAQIIMSFQHLMGCVKEIFHV